MSLQEKTTSKFGEWRNLVIGVVIGLVAGPIITSFIGWQVGFSTMEEQVSAAVIEQQALFCAERVMADPALCHFRWARVRRENVILLPRMRRCLIRTLLRAELSISVSANSQRDSRAPIFAAIQSGSHTCAS